MLLVTINRPQARDAVSAAVALGVGEALDYTEEGADVWVVVITAADDASFCAGQDLKEAAQVIHLDDPRLRAGPAAASRPALARGTVDRTLL